MIRYRMTLEKFDERGVLEKSVVKSIDDNEDLCDESYECGSLIASCLERFTERVMLALAQAVVMKGEYSGLDIEHLDEVFNNAACRCVEAYDEHDAAVDRRFQSES